MTLESRIKNMERLAGKHGKHVLEVIQEDQLDQYQAPFESDELVLDPRTGCRMRQFRIISEFPETE